MRDNCPHARRRDGQPYRLRANGQIVRVSTVPHRSDTRLRTPPPRLQLRLRRALLSAPQRGFPCAEVSARSRRRREDTPAGLHGCSSGPGKDQSADLDSPALFALAAGGGAMFCDAGRIVGGTCALAPCSPNSPVRPCRRAFRSSLMSRTLKPLGAESSDSSPDATSGAAGRCRAADRARCRCRRHRGSAARSLALPR